MGGNRCPKEEKFVPLEDESGFPSFPHEVDNHFTERGHDSKAAVIAHS